MMTCKLTEHKCAQCHVNCFNDFTVQLVSYVTPVVEIDEYGYIHALPKFNCSATTRNHVGWFLKEYTNINYESLKKAALKGHAIHAYHST